MSSNVIAEIEREPLCDLPYCPAPTDPDWHVCLVDGSTTIEHHHVEGRGKKRTLDPTKVVPLSVANHKRISLNEWGDGILVQADGSMLYRIWDLHNETIHESKPWWMQPRPESSAVEIQQNSETPTAGTDGNSTAVLPAGVGDTAASMPPDPLVPAGPLAEDWRDLTDDELQAKFDAADQMQGLAFQLKCKAVHAYRENHVQQWGEGWTSQAIERFNVSRRTLYSYANIWEISATHCTSLDIAPLTDSKSLMAFIGQKAVADGAVAMEAAVAHHAEYAEPPTVAALAHKLGEERGERAQHECPDCGALHTVKA